MLALSNNISAFDHVPS